MAFSNRQGRKYQSRRERGYKPRAFGKGFDRWGMPVIFGLRDNDGNEYMSTSSHGLCDEHLEERCRKLGAARGRSELFERRST